MGDIVRKGQHLYQIDVSRTTFSGNVSLNSLEAINNQLSQIDSIINNTQKNKELTLINLRQQLAQYQKAHKNPKSWSITQAKEWMICGVQWPVMVLTNVKG